MSRLGIATFLLATSALIAAAATADAATLRVTCGGHDGLTTIGAALRALQGSENHGPNTINVSGNCNEDVVIQSMDHLALNAVNAASISDPSHGVNPTLVIDDSRDVSVNNFVINGGSPGVVGQDVVDCQNGSLCRLNGNTVQNSANGGGIGVWYASHAVIAGGVLRNTGWAGLVAGNYGQAQAFGVLVQGNATGVFEYNGARVQFVNSTSSGNFGDGFTLRGGAELICAGCTINGNQGDGIHAEQSSSAVLQFYFGPTSNLPYSVTGNTGAGVSLTNLSGATFRNHGSVASNAGPFDVACNPSFTAAGGLANAGVLPSRTNCAGP